MTGDILFEGKSFRRDDSILDEFECLEISFFYSAWDTKPIISYFLPLACHVTPLKAQVVFVTLSISSKAEEDLRH